MACTDSRGKRRTDRDLACSAYGPSIKVGPQSLARSWLHGRHSIQTPEAPFEKLRSKPSRWGGSRHTPPAPQDGALGLNLLAARAPRAAKQPLTHRAPP